MGAATHIASEAKSQAALAEEAASGRWLDVVADDGAVIRVREDGRGPPLLLVHGWAARSDFFAPQALGLKDRFRVLRPDLRGHGRTSAIGPLSIDRLSADCVAVAEQLDLTGAIAVGWSMGAMVLWRALAASPRFAARLAGLVVVDMAARITNDDEWRLGLMSAGEADRLPEVMRQDWRSFAAGFAPNVFAPDAKPALVAAWSTMFHDNDSSAMAAFWASMSKTDCRADIAAIDVPMLVCFGQKSRLYGPQTAAWIVKSAQAAQAFGFLASGHAPQLEEPEVFNRLICEFAGSPLHPVGGSAAQGASGSASISGS